MSSAPSIVPDVSATPALPTPRSQVSTGGQQSDSAAFWPTSRRQRNETAARQHAGCSATFRGDRIDADARLHSKQRQQCDHPRDAQSQLFGHQRGDYRQRQRCGERRRDSRPELEDCVRPGSGSERGAQSSSADGARSGVISRLQRRNRKFANRQWLATSLKSKRSGRAAELVRGGKY